MYCIPVLFDSKCVPHIVVCSVLRITHIATHLRRERGREGGRERGREKEREGELRTLKRYISTSGEDLQPLLGCAKTKIHPTLPTSLYLVLRHEHDDDVPAPYPIHLTAQGIDVFTLLKVDPPTHER